MLSALPCFDTSGLRHHGFARTGATVGNGPELMRCKRVDLVATYRLTLRSTGRAGTRLLVVQRRRGPPVSWNVRPHSTCSVPIQLLAASTGHGAETVDSASLRSSPWTSRPCTCGGMPTNSPSFLPPFLRAT